jgi:hypothetical protein
MNTNVKLLSPNIKKENFIIPPQNFPINNNKFNSGLNNKVGSIKAMNNNQNNALINENLQKSIFQGKKKHLS